MKDLEFRIKEYDTAVNERAEIIREINRIEKGCLIVAGIIFSWLLTQTNNSTDKLYLFSWLIPLIITGLGGLRVLALNSMLENKEEYLRKLEKKLSVDDPEGLFSFYHKHSKRDHNKRYKKSGEHRKTFIGQSSLIYWGVLIVLCAAVPISKFMSI